jgi:two-component system heavy metal sensor histidine kinase CusS
MTLRKRLLGILLLAISASVLAAVCASKFIANSAALALVLSALIAIVGFVVHRAVDRLLAPMRAILHATRSHSSARVADSAAAEFAELARALDEVLQQAARNVDQANRFSADAAHELQTPLTILQGHVEDGLQHAAEDSEEQQRLSLLLRQIQRLKEIVHKLLLLSRADAGTLTTRNRCTVRIDHQLRDALEDFDILAPELTLESQIADECLTDGVEALIAHLLRNLLSNAIKYNQAGGTVRVILKQEMGNSCLRVGNIGPGISKAARPHVFERFFRADESRNDGVTGSGLGLSLAREIAKAHCGDLQLEPDLGDGWTWFRATLPPPI